MRRHVLWLLFCCCQREDPDELSVGPEVVRQPLVSETPVWTRLIDPTPPAIPLPVFVFDTSRHVAIAIGARSTWERGADGWTRRLLTPHPSLFGTSVGAFDSDRNRVVLMMGAPRLTETWEYDGTAWTALTPAHPPTDLVGGFMVYDPVRHRTLLVESDYEATRMRLWEWDGTDWLEKGPANRPSPRRDFALAFDTRRGVAVLHGGIGFSSTATLETWEWNGTDWTRRVAGGPGVYYHSMAWDSDRQRIVLTGGGADVYEYDGASWRRFIVSGPGLRGSPGLLYDPDRKRTEMLDGWLNQTVNGLRDEWEWNGAQWSRYPRAARPAYGKQNLVWDEKDARVLAYASSVFAFADAGALWTWDGGTWTPLAIAGTPDRLHSVVTYDSDNQRLAVVGGFPLSDLTFFDGARWTTLPSPSALQVLSDPAIAYARDRHEIVLFGGSQSSDETWLFDGGQWATGAVAIRPQPRSSHAMSYDEVRKRVVMFGGGSDEAVWEFLGNRWVAQTPAIHPRFRRDSAMTWNPDRERVVMFGGDGLSGALRLDDVWEWDGRNWAQIVTDGGPRGRSTHGMAYDRARHVLVVSGGTDGEGEYIDDTWELRFVRATGAPCSFAESCSSGFCVDGVCCESTCGNGALDCMACSRDAGTSTDGTCGAIRAELGQVCVLDAGRCDLSGTCSADSNVCAVPAAAVCPGGQPLDEDGGSMPPPQVRGCGCAGSGEVLLALLSMLTLRLAGRRHHALPVA